MAQIRADSSFEIEAEFTFSNGKVLSLSDSLESVIFKYSNGSFIPNLQMSFIIDTAFSNALLMPYTVKLTIVEKNIFNEEKTFFVSEWLSYTHVNATVRRNDEKFTDATRVLVTKDYVSKDMFAACNTTVGGIFRQKKLKDIVSSLWGNTNHGSTSITIDKFDNMETYDEVWIPNLKFFQAMGYLTRAFGFFESHPMIFTGLKKSKQTFYVSTINEMLKKEDPLKLFYIRSGAEAEDHKVDNLEYVIASLPDLRHDFQGASATLNKKIPVIKHSADKFFEEEELDVVNIARAESHVSNTDLFDNFLGKYVDPETIVSIPNADMYSIKESMSMILGNTTRTVSISIDEPFRLSHWSPGRKVIVDTGGEVYMAEDVTYYISSTVYSFKRAGGKKWQGFVKVDLNTSSPKKM